MEIENTESPVTKEAEFFGLTNTVGGDEPTEVESGEDTEVIIDDTSATAASEKTAPEEKAPSEQDLDKMSAKVQKRIDKLTWQKGEEKRRADKAESDTAEAIRAARAINQKNQQYERIISDGEATLVQNIKERSTFAMDAARQSYKTAHEEGDTEAIIKAQESFNRAEREQADAFRVENEYLQRQRHQQWMAQNPQPRYQQPQTPAQQPQPQKAAPPSEQSKTWSEKNTWFHDPEHGEMTAIAYATHAKLIAEGVAPDSHSYYDGIDKRVQELFPAYFRDAKNSASASRSPSTVVASSSRSIGTKPRKVRLKPSEVRIAKALNLTNEQYAKQVLKEMK